MAKVLDLSKGREITKDKIVRIDGNVIVTESNHQQRIINLDWRNISEMKVSTKGYDSIDQFIGDIAIVKLNNKYGLINRNGEEVLEPIYDEIFQNGDYLVIKLGKQQGFASSKEFILKPQYDDISGFKDGLAVVRQADKYGVINLEGNMILDLNYDNIFIVNNERFIVTVNKQKGVIDDKRKEIIAINKRSIVSCRKDKYFCVKPSKTANCQIFDYEGKFVKRLSFGERYYQGNEMPNNGSLYAIADENFNRITKYIFESIGKFHNGLAIFDRYSYAPRQYSTCGLIDQNGIELKEASYCTCKYLGDGVFSFCKDYKEGFCCNGKVIKKNLYNTIQYIGGLLLVREDKKFGLMQKDGTLITDLKYDTLVEHANGFYLFELQKKYYLINKHGEAILELNDVPNVIEVRNNLIVIKYIPVNPMESKITGYLCGTDGSRYLEDEQLTSLEIVDNDKVIINNKLIHLNDIKYIDREENVAVQDNVKHQEVISGVEEEIIVPLVDDYDALLRYKKEILIKYYTSPSSELNQLIHELDVSDQYDSVLEKLIRFKLQKERLNSRIDRLFERELKTFYEELKEKKNIEKTKKLK